MMADCMACPEDKKKPATTIWMGSVPVCDEHRDQFNNFFDIEPLESGNVLCKECGQEISERVHLCLGGGGGRLD